MENVSFSSNAPEVKAPAIERVVEQAKGILHTQPGMMRTAMLGLLGVMLVFFVLRPLAGQVVHTLKEPLLLERGGAKTGLGKAVAKALPVTTDEAAQEWFEAGAARENAATVPLRRPRPVVRDAVYQDVMEHIQREPAQSTRLLETWIGEVEEEF